MTTPSYLTNAYFVDLESIYSLEDRAIVDVFKLVDSSGLMLFLSYSLDIYVPEPKNFYGRGSVIHDEKVVMLF